MNQLYIEYMDLAYSRYSEKILADAKLRLRNSLNKKNTEKFNIGKKMVQMNLKYAKDDVHFAERRIQLQRRAILQIDPMAQEQLNHMKNVIDECMPCVWTPIGVKQMWNATQVSNFLLLPGMEAACEKESSKRPAPTFSFVAASEPVVPEMPGGIKEIVMNTVPDLPCSLPISVDQPCLREPLTPKVHSVLEVPSTPELLTIPQGHSTPIVPIFQHFIQKEEYTVIPPETSFSHFYEGYEPFIKRHQQYKSLQQTPNKKYKLTVETPVQPKAPIKPPTNEITTSTAEEQAIFLGMFSLCRPDVAVNAMRQVEERSFRQAKCPYLGCSPMFYKDKNSRKTRQRRSAKFEVDPDLILHTPRPRVGKVYKDYV